ncbi:hydrogenase [Aquirufa nivalisilvae]|uniref:Hydroxylaminobenzene mutase HabB n=1 Tax=Aquirufa nivalisilvae TaxID=2516557 RepID=A0A2S2DTK4_9BACT|nr:hydrogenase [Aquirufa nivalisilvae]AWL08706.1 Hydroxylaminobenzene mutase HabB [Aquirufa nivalisilvae]
METKLSSKQQADKLIFLGVFLFFLGLVIGLLIPILAKPRIGLSSHLEGVMNGMFLILLGLIWNRLTLSTFWLKSTFRLAVFGTYINFLTIGLAAATGAGKLLPIAGGTEQGPMIESIITIGLISLSIAMLLVCILVMKGLVYQNKN